MARRVPRRSPYNLSTAYKTLIGKNVLISRQEVAAVDCLDGHVSGLGVGGVSGIDVVNSFVVSSIEQFTNKVKLTFVF